MVAAKPANDPGPAAFALPPETPQDARRSAVRPRALGPTIWMSDVKRFSDAGAWRRIQGPWYGAARKLAKETQPDDRSAAFFVVAFNTLGKAFREGGGKCQLPLEELARRADSASRSRMRIALGQLEAGGLLDRFFVRERLERVGVFPRANLYLPRMPDPATDALGPFDRMNASLVRWAAAFGLEAHPWGLNGTPIASRHRSTLRPD